MAAGLRIRWRGCMRACRGILGAMGEPETTGDEQGSSGRSGPRDQAGRFPAGHSGNPSGRPRGARNRATLLAQELLDGSGELIVRKAIALARRGDPVALRLCIERIVPRRANVVELSLPAVRAASDIADAAAAVIEAAAAAKISLQEAKEFMWLLEARRKAIETQELAVRVELLERDAAADPDEELGSRVRRLERER